MFNKRIILISILILSFIVSLVLFMSNDKKYTKISFKFYNELSNELVLEDRYVLLSKDYTDQATIIVDELFLGPHSVFNKKLVPFDLKYNLFYVNERVAYLDIPMEILATLNDSSISLEEIFILIEDNIIRNIKRINNVIITVDGNLLNAGPSEKELPQEALDDKK